MNTLPLPAWKYLPVKVYPLKATAFHSALPCSFCAETDLLLSTRSKLSSIRGIFKIYDLPIVPSFLMCGADTVRPFLPVPNCLTNAVNTSKQPIFCSCTASTTLAVFALVW